MADTVIIPLSVQFKDAVQNFKSLVEQYQKELDKLTPGTSIYKSIEAQLKQAMALVKRTDLQANIGVSKESQITKMTSDLEAVQHILGNVKEAFSNLGFKDLNLGHGSFEQFKNDVKTIENEINSLNAKKQELENLSVAGALNKAGLDKKGFNKGDLDKGVIQYYNEVTAAIQKAEQAIVKLQEQQKLLNTSITANQGTMDQTKNAHFLNNLYNNFGMSNLKMDKVSSTYSNMLTEQYNAGTLGSVHVQNALKMIGLDDATISMLQSSGADAAQKFQEVLANLNQTKMQKSVSGYLKENYGGAQGMKNEAKAYDNANKQLTADNAKLGEIASKIKTQENAIKRYTVRRDKISGVTKEYSTLQNNLNTLNQRITTLERQVSSSVGKGLGTGNAPAGDPQASAGIAKNEAQQQMSSAIDNMARRWVGTYAIVNKVRQAIRQAWNDIKSLDQAMTNIAVVTSMSVDQLWGQIDQYMSIAQQYGVTTQGVYEVSQIFYQQGLGTSDVMAATTETLKMARIAGMDYKEAADAMTVAIRAFKMEMTDAAHVTDVYSKVASITASDSNELATAMSKTASSAENVGSSFENTTAMLAVMIETTRESAQNLGSALKSIISRYGEMKAGLTKDSEGEEIDYNKVDTALKSVSISIKDAQGQFRDFDDVIFELSEKWDSLDKNTQRYIATIMAGNRQQSRFIALVDNWERLDEISDAANNDADDAGLIQYSKTLDSLDAKINNLKNSFQQLYMGIADGAAFKGLLTFLNEIINGFSNMGSGLLVALPGMIAGIRALFTFIKLGATTAFGGMYAQAKTSTELIANYSINRHKQVQAEKNASTTAGTNQRKATEQQSENQISSHAVKTYKMTQASKTAMNKMEANKRALQENLAAERVATIKNTKKYQTLINKGYGQRTAYQKALVYQTKSEKRRQYLEEGWKSSRAWAGASMGLSIAGAGLSTWGAQQSGSGNYVAGAVMGMGGNALSGAAMGAMAGPWGALIGGIIGALSGLPNLLKELDHNVKLQRKYEESKKKEEDANLKRAEDKNDYTSLVTLIDKVNSTEEFKNDSEEQYQEWVNANAALVEKYPTLFGYMDEYGNAIADLTNSTEYLSSKLILAADSEQGYYEAAIQAEQDKMMQYEDHRFELKNVGITSGSGALFDEYGMANDNFGGVFLNLLKDRATTGQISSTSYVTPKEIDNYAQELNINLWKLLTRLNSVDLPEKWFKGADTFFKAEESRAALTQNGNFTQIEADLIVDLMGSGALKQDNNGYSYAKELSDYYTASQEILGIQALQRNSIEHSIYTASVLAGQQDISTKIKGFNPILTTYALYFQDDIGEEALKNIYNDLDGYQVLSGPIVEFYEQLGQQEKQIFENLYTKLEHITLQELNNQLLSIGANKQLIESYSLEWYGKNYQSRSNLIQSIEKDFFSTNSTQNFELEGIMYSSEEIASLATYSGWLRQTGRTGTMQDKKDYYNLVNKVIEESNHELNNFILQSTEETGQAYIKFLRSQNNMIEMGGITGEAARERLTAIQGILQTIYSEDFLTQYGLPEDFDIEEYAKLLLNNAGSQEWANDLEDFEKKYNLNLADFNKYVFENFGTYLAQTTENMNSAIEDFKNISEVQSKGIDDFEEALKYYKSYAGDLTWDDFYTWTEDGKLIFKNIDQVFTQIGNDIVETSQQYSKALENLKSLAGPGFYDGDFYTLDSMIADLSKDDATFGLSSIKNDMDRIGSFSEEAYQAVESWWQNLSGPFTSENANELIDILTKYAGFSGAFEKYKYDSSDFSIMQSALESYGFNTAQIADIENWLNAEENADASYDDLLAYIQEQYGLLYAQSEYYIQQRKSLAKQARQLTFSTAVEGDIKEYTDKQLVGQIIQSGNEFTKEQLQSIGNNLDATYDEVAEIFSLQYDSNKNVWIQKPDLNLDASKTLIQNKVTEVTKAYEDAKKTGSGKTADEVAALELEKERWELIQTYFDGTDDIYTRLFNNNSKWKAINESIENYSKKQIFSDGEVKLEELKTLTENEEVLTNLLDKGILTWNDALQSFELTQTLTDEQKAILETAGIDPNTWTNLVSKQMKSWQEQAEEIISNGGKDLTAQDIATLKKAGYNLEISEGESLSLSQYKTLADANDATAAVYLEQQSKEVSNKLLEIVLKPAEVTLEDLINLGETIGGEGSINTEGYIAAIEAAKEGNFDAINGIVEELLQAADGILDISADSLNAQKTINKNEVSSSIQDSLSSAYSDLTNVSLSSLTELWKTVYSKTEIDSGTVNSYEDAIKAAEQGETKALINILQQLTQTAIQQGYDIDTSALEAAYKDAQNTLIKSLITMLESAVSGTLSAADLNSLSDQLNLDLKNYTLQTVDGWQLNTEGLMKTAIALKDKYGDTLGVTEKLYDSLVGDGKAYKGWHDLNEEAKRLKDKSEELALTDTERSKELEKQSNLLKEMAYYAQKMADDARFDFMNQDVTNGMGDTWDTFVSNIDSVKTAINTLKQKGSIDLKEFQNLMAFVGKETEYDFKKIGISAEEAKTQITTAFTNAKEGSGTAKFFEGLGFNAQNFEDALSKYGKGAELYKLYTKTIVAANAEIDSIDAEAIMNLGLSMEGVSSGFTSSVQKVAESQIEYLQGIYEMLEVMEALEGIGSVDFGMNLDFTVNGQKFNLAEGIDAVLNWSDEKLGGGRDALLSEIASKLQKSTGDGGLGSKLFGYLFGEEINLDNEVERWFLENLSSINISELTEGQASFLADEMAKATLGMKEGSADYEAAIAKVYYDYFSKGIENIPEKANALLIAQGNSLLKGEKFAAPIGDASSFEFVFKGDTPKVKLLDKNGKEITGELTSEQIEEITKIARKQIGDIDNLDLVVNANGTITYRDVNPEIKTKFGGEDAQFDGTNYIGEETVDLNGEEEGGEVTVQYTAAADGSSIEFTRPDGTPIGDDADYQAAVQQIAENKGLTEIEIEGEATGKYKIAPELEQTDQMTQLVQSVTAIQTMLDTGKVLQLAIDNTSIDAAADSLNAIVSAWETLQQFDKAGPLSLIVNRGTPNGQNGQGEESDQQSGAIIDLHLNSAGVVEELITLYTQITTNSIPGAQSPIIGVQLALEEGAVQDIQDTLLERTLTQPVELKYSGSPNLSTLTRTVKLDYEADSANIVVTVNDGAAGATGNVALAMGRLVSGAAFAQGTLMGELGPELYVQDGQYHIAGANGPEFVDLHSDAIVFNHLQTEGLMKRGHITSHGKPKTSEHHAIGAYASGNAMASGISEAKDAVQDAISLWSSLLNASLGDMLGASGGGGGGGNSIKAVTQELQEWYNLLRKIEKLEKDINLLQAERNNLAKGDGAARLRSMRQEQQLLREQAATQAVLLDYQRLQLDRQKNEINNPDSIWSQFLEVGENGLLQYKKGNETNDGKGALEVLQELNEMSGEDQIDFLEDLGYTYTTADGEELKDSKLVEQFYKELQEQIDQYDALYDTVREAEIALENYTSSVNELEEEIRQNKLDLEQEIYDIIVEAWEKEIELLEEQSELIQEANDTYINGIREAVNTEKELYDQNQKAADRESLQRQLSLLRRSGGSASEIANLEKQLDDMLKDEYFEHQEDMIENIQEANDKQIKLLEQQIKIQQESLEYQQEHGIIWEKVAHIMSLSRQEILDFMQGTTPGFFAKSAEQQYDTLMDWSEKVGIFTEDRKLDQYASEGIANYFDNGNIWDDSSIANYQSTFNSMSKTAQGSIRTMFGEAYAQAINEGQDSTNARNAGIAAITPWLNGTYDAEQAEKYNEPTRPTGGDAKDWRYVVGGSLHLRDSASTSGKSLGTHPTGTKVKVLQDLGDWCKVEVNGQTGYMMSKYLAKSGNGSSAETGASKYRAYYNVVDSAGKVLRSNAYGAGSSESQARNNAYYMGNKWMKENNKTGTVKITKVSAYSQGGLVDYTGLAMVHGSKKKPESFLNAEQTARITDALKAQQNINPLKETFSRLQNAINLLGENIRSIIIPSANQANNINIASGAITISVQELNDSYDIDEVVNDIQGRILSIAAKSTNRSVNRR